MIFSNPDQIGIIACPGAELFSAKLVADLEAISHKKFLGKVHCLSEKYGLPSDEVVRQMNLSLDLRSTGVDSHSSPNHFRSASFQIPVRFTRFANGEFKAEIMSTVRNVDVYILQDVENHVPLCIPRKRAGAGALGERPHLLPAGRRWTPPSRRGPSG